MSERDVEIISKTVMCACGATGIAYDEQAYDEDAEYWAALGMWGRAETETIQCEDCYPMSWKNVCQKYGEDTLHTLLGPIFQQITQLREMGLNSVEANEIVFNVLEFGGEDNV